MYWKNRSKRTRACAIQPRVRKAVAIRDSGKCIVCGRPGISNAHIIPRSQGGLGTEQNIVTLCPHCHHEYDNGMNHEKYKKVIYDYIKSKYEYWNEENMKFNKWRR